MTQKPIKKPNTKSVSKPNASSKVKTSAQKKSKPAITQRKRAKAATAQSKRSLLQRIWAELKQSYRWVLSFALLFLFSAAVWMSLLKAYPVQGQKQYINIAAGDSYSSLIQRWDNEGKIHFPLLLKLYQRLVINDSLKAGVYEVYQGTAVKDVLLMLSDANNAQMNRILVIEGTTFKQLKQQLVQDPNVKKTLLHLSNNELLKALAIPYSHPEGLFAPDTYFFAKGETDKTILKRLYERQQKDLDQAWQNRAKNLPYANPYDALIMASIIEKETSLDRELTQVSGVFVRRLQQGMRLQTDPTVIYGMGDAYQGNIRKQDLRTPTPYNTYTQAGLPPTPIALPSRKAIEAAMHPDNSNNLYFVATGNGGHTFSETYAQHQQAVERYLTTLRAKGN